MNTTSISNKQIWNIAYPIILGNLAQTLIALTDTAFLGHLSNIALGAVMITAIYYYVFSTLAWGFSLGIQIFIARRLGEKRYDQIGNVFNHGILFVIPIAILLFSIQHIWNNTLLNYAISSPKIYEAAIEFMNYRHYGILFVCFNFLFRALYIGLQNTKVITYSTIIMAVINIFLDYSLIFGEFGFPQMRVGGAALASVCAEISAFLFFIFYTLRFVPFRKYSIFIHLKYSADLMKNVIKLALPTMIQKLFSFGTWFIFFVLVERLGELPTAVSGIIRSTYMLLLIPVFAFAATSNTLVSNLIGAQREKEIPATLHKILKLCLFILIPLVIICIIKPTLILSIYTPATNTTLITAAIPSLFVVCCATFTMSWGNIYFEAVSGTGNTIHALWLESIVLVFYSICVWFTATVIATEVAWVWISEILYGFGIGLVSVIYLKFADWHKKKI